MNYLDVGTNEEEAPGPLYCVNHPAEETYVRCSKCGRPVCHRCRVATPAGLRCFDCANLQVLPTYAISADFYLKAAVAGLVVAGLLGAAMGFFPDWEFWLALALGILSSEAVAIAANQKRGPGLQMVAMAAVVFGFIVSRVILQINPPPLDLGGFLSPTADLLPFHITQYTIMWLALALFLANRRLR
jgi:hypothetical protein